MDSRNIYLSGGQYRNSLTEQLESYLVVANGLKQQVIQIKIPFLAHGMSVDPLNENRLLAFEKRGVGAAEIDLTQQKLTRLIEPMTDCHFYGHGLFSHDGTKFVATETHLPTKQGRLTVRDAQTLSVLGVIPTYGLNPHDCHWLDDGKVLVISHGGSSVKSNTDRPCLTYLEFATQKLLHKQVMSAEYVNTGHIVALPNQQIAVSSAPRDGLNTKDIGAVTIINRLKSDLVPFKKPQKVIQRMFGEALSMAYDPIADLLAVTHPEGDLITFWHVPSLRLFKAFDIDRPRGINMNAEQGYWVVTGGKNQAHLWKIERNLLQAELLIEQSFMTGSHLYRLSELRGY